jgi:hypothetical protein
MRRAREEAMTDNEIVLQAQLDSANEQIAKLKADLRESQMAEITRLGELQAYGEQLERLRLRLRLARAQAVYSFLVDREWSTARAFRALSDAGIGGRYGVRAALSRRAWVTNQKLVRVGRILNEARAALEAGRNG